MQRRQFDHLVVGAGFAGAVIAERLASAGRSVLVIDRRDHLGGNAFDEPDDHGIAVHRYGPHIFHTNSQAVIDHLSRFTAWRPYEHRVLARHDGHLYPIPVNRTTLERFFACELADEAAAEALLARQRETVEQIRTSEDVVVSTLGRRLYEAFFRGYTRKQWRRDPAELDAAVCARIPVRLDRDDRYFSDRYQQMPADGYAALFQRLLDHPRIRVETGTAYEPARHRGVAPHLVWTGPVDAFFGHCHGPLPYRSLRFEHEHVNDTAYLQPVAVVNEPSPEVPYTRTTEFKHLTGQQSPGTSIVREFPLAEDGGDPYYPVPSKPARALARRYADLAAQEPNTTFLGRLAQYRYYNMDQVVAAALTAAARLLDQPEPLDG